MEGIKNSAYRVGARKVLKDFNITDQEIDSLLNETFVEYVISMLDDVVGRLGDDKQKLEAMRKNVNEIDKSFFDAFNGRINDKSRCFNFPKKIKAGGKRTHRIRRTKY
jgi:hypothetical protein